MICAFTATIINSARKSHPKLIYYHVNISFVKAVSLKLELFLLGSILADFDHII